MHLNINNRSINPFFQLYAEFKNLERYCRTCGLVMLLFFVYSPVLHASNNFSAYAPVKSQIYSLLAPQGWHVISQINNDLVLSSTRDQKNVSAPSLLLSRMKITQSISVAQIADQAEKTLRTSLRKALGISLSLSASRSVAEYGTIRKFHTKCPDGIKCSVVIFAITDPKRKNMFSLVVYSGSSKSFQRLGGEEFLLIVASTLRKNSEKAAFETLHVKENSYSDRFIDSWLSKSDRDNVVTTLSFLLGKNIDQESKNKFLHALALNFSALSNANARKTIAGHKIYYELLAQTIRAIRKNAFKKYYQALLRQEYLESVWESPFNPGAPLLLMLLKKSENSWQVPSLEKSQTITKINLLKLYKSNFAHNLMQQMRKIDGTLAQEELRSIMSSYNLSGTNRETQIIAFKNSSGANYLAIRYPSYSKQTLINDLINKGVNLKAHRKKNVYIGHARNSRKSVFVSMMDWGYIIGERQYLELALAHGARYARFDKNSSLMEFVQKKQYGKSGNDWSEKIDSIQFDPKMSITTRYRFNNHSFAKAAQMYYNNQAIFKSDHGKFSIEEPPLILQRKNTILTGKLVFDAKFGRAVKNQLVNVFRENSRNRVGQTDIGHQLFQNAFFFNMMTFQAQHDARMRAQYQTTMRELSSKIPYKHTQESINRQQQREELYRDGLPGAKFP